MNKRDITKIIVDGFKNDRSDDEILQEMFETKNIDFTELRPVFNEIIKEKGLRLSTKERKIKTTELMEGVEAIADAEELLKYVAMLQTELKVTSTKALGSLRTWAKANGVELPKAPKASKARKPGFGGHYKKILDDIVACRKAGTEVDKKSVVAFCHANNIPEAYASVALNVLHFAQVWSGEIVEAEVEAEAEVETAEAA